MLTRPGFVGLRGVGLEFSKVAGDRFGWDNANRATRNVADGQINLCQISLGGQLFKRIQLGNPEKMAGEAAQCTPAYAGAAQVQELLFPNKNQRSASAKGNGPERPIFWPRYSRLPQSR